MTMIGILMILLGSCLVVTSRAPPDPKPSDIDAINYLQRFGYLPPSNNEKSNEITQLQLSNALKNLQRMGGIPETGEMNEETEKLMKAKRCGNKDYVMAGSKDKRYALKGVPWKNRAVTYRFISLPRKVNNQRGQAEVTRAFKAWADVSKLSFTLKDDDSANIPISAGGRGHGCNYPFDGKGGVLAHAFFPNNSNISRLHFDDDEPYDIAPAETKDYFVNLFSVAIHEIGHSIGLDHSNIRGAIMFPFYSPNMIKLHSDDIRGIGAAYRDMFIVICDLKQSAVDVLLKTLHELYAVFARKNPFYSIDMPIRCDLFDTNLQSSVDLLEKQGYITSA